MDSLESIIDSLKKVDANIEQIQKDLIKVPLSNSMLAKALRKISKFK